MKKRMFLVLFLVGLMLMRSMASAYTGNALVEAVSYTHLRAHET